MTSDIRLHKISALSLITFFTLLFSLQVNAASGFVKLGDIKGESQSADSQHEGWIEIASVGWPGGSAPTQGAVANGRTRYTEITLTKIVDTSTPAIHQACSNGTHYPTAELHVRREGGDPDRPVVSGYIFYEVTLTCPVLAPANPITFLPDNQDSTARSGDDRPTEDIKLNFERLEIVPVVNTQRAQPGIRPQRITPAPTVTGPQTAN